MNGRNDLLKQLIIIAGESLFNGFVYQIPSVCLWCKDANT